MIGYKDRFVEIGMRVDVYRNLHTGSYSIRCAKSKVVLLHANTVRLKSCSFIVSESGRQRTVQEKRKRVHAWVTGILIGINEARPLKFSEVIYYNPYKTSHFLKGNSIIQQADEVFFEGRFCYVTHDQKHQLPFIESEQLCLFE